MGATERHEFLRADGESTAGRKDGSGSLRVLVDEMGANVLLSPLFTPLLAQGGTSTLLGTAPRHRATNWGQNTTLFLASMTLGGMGPCLAVVGSITREVVPRGLRREGTGTDALSGADRGDGQPLSSPKGGWVRQLIEERGCELVYLPAYSPGAQPHRASLRQGQDAA